MPHQEKNLEELLVNLANARKNKDLYLVARNVMMLRGEGAQADLTEDEKDDLSKALSEARRKWGRLPVHPGYEVARWHLILQYFFRKDWLGPTEGDKKLIQEALQHYRGTGNMEQLAGLVHTIMYLGMSFDLVLTPVEQAIFAKNLADLV